MSDGAPDNRAQLLERVGFLKDVVESDGLAQLPGVLLKVAAAGDDWHVGHHLQHPFEHLESRHASGQGEVQDHDMRRQACAGGFTQDGERGLARPTGGNVESLGLEDGGGDRQDMRFVINDQDTSAVAWRWGGLGSRWEVHHKGWAGWVQVAAV